MYVTSALIRFGFETDSNDIVRPESSNYTCSRVTNRTRFETAIQCQGSRITIYTYVIYSIRRAVLAGLSNAHVYELVCTVLCVCLFFFLYIFFVITSSSSPSLLLRQNNAIKMIKGNSFVCLFFIIIFCSKTIMSFATYETYSTHSFEKAKQNKSHSRIKIICHL